MENTESEKAEWVSLLGKAMASLDDQESEVFEKRKRVAAKALARRGLKEAPVDKASVIRFLLRYAKCADGEGYGRCVELSGVSKVELVGAYSLWPESKTVYEYVRGIRMKLKEIENEDILDEARSGLRRLCTEEGCELNAKAVITAVERLDRKNFGDERVAAKTAGKAQVTYNFPQMTVNMIMSPAELSRKGIVSDGAVEVDGVASASPVAVEIGVKGA